MAFVPTQHRFVARANQKEPEGRFGDDGLLPGNRFLELKALRPSLRTHAIKNKLIADPENRTDLTGAITVVGTCLDMCPEFERHEREFQKDVDEWEKIPGTNPKRIDHTRAVKKYRRSAAGNEDPLPSDLRPPHILKKTLDYLLEDLLPTHGLAATYAFIRDRTRAIRTDFVIQHIKGPSAIECFERIARFHILAVHAFCDGEGVAGEEKEEIRGFDYWLEVEQMMKTLQSLIQFYDDRPVTDPQPPNEAEFRAYYLLAHIRSNSILHRLHTLPQHIFLSPIMQSALEFRAHAQSFAVSTTNTQGGPASGSTHKSRTKSLAASPPLQNFFTRFFKRIEDPATSYLLACLLEYHFGGVRKGAIHALWKAYSTRHRGIPIPDVGTMLGLATPNAAHIPEEEVKVEEVLKKFGIRVESDDEIGGKRVVLNRLSTFEPTAQIAQRHSSNLVEPKRGGQSDLRLVNGDFEKAQATWKGTMQAMPTIPAASSFVATPQTRLPTPTSTPAPATHPSLPSFPVSTTQTNGAPVDQFVQGSSAGWFLEAAGNKSSPFGVNIAPAFAFKKLDSVPTYVPSTSAFIPPMVPSEQTIHSLNGQTILAEVAPDQDELEEERKQQQQQIAAKKDQEERRRAEKHERELRAQMKERREKEKKVAEEENRRKEQEEQRQLEEEREREHRREEQRKRKEKEEEERKMIEREYQEQLKQQRKERTRMADLTFMNRIFERWKRVVIKKGEVRRAFKRSILEMGTNTGSSRGIIQSTKDREPEDLISWEDMSEFSMPEFHLNGIKRRRRSKGKTRMDDEKTLTAIREAEQERLKLWDRGTFLRSVKKTRCRGDVWLSTSPHNKSTREWLRVKFDVQSTAEDDVICIPHGNGHGPGLIVIDLTPGDDESVVQQDLFRLRHVLSGLPANRYYIPSVLILQWTGSELLPTPIAAEVNTLLKRQIILNVVILAFENGDLNDQFLRALKEIHFDTVGKLVKKASPEDVFSIFLKIWDARLAEALGSCQVESSVDDPHSFNWPLYGQIIEVFISLLQLLAEGVAKICKIEMISESWPIFDGSAITDDRSAFQTFTEYIESSWLAFEEPAMLLKAELIAEMGQNKKFDVRHVPNRMAYLVLLKFQSSTSSHFHLHIDIQEPLPGVLEFSEAIRSALIAMDEKLSSGKSSRKRSAPDDYHLNGNSSEKRHKRDTAVGIVNADDYAQAHVDGLSKVTTKGEKKLDALTKLRSSIMKAKQSVEDLRAARADDKKIISTEPETPTRLGVGSLTRISSRSPSTSPRRRRLCDLEDMAAFHPGKTFDMDYYQGSSAGFTRAGSLSRTSPDSLFLRPLPSRFANDKLTTTIERAKKSIQDAWKSREKDVNKRDKRGQML